MFVHPLVLCGVLVAGFAAALAIDVVIAGVFVKEFGTVKGSLLYVLL